MQEDINPDKYTANLRPGKFEGAHKAAEYFYEQMCNGDGETLVHEDNAMHAAEVFHVNVEECEAFGFQLGTWITLYEGGDGFVWITQDSSRELAETRYRKWAGIE